jgi:putative hydrolase of the HAD superfamily
MQRMSKKMFVELPNLDRKIESCVFDFDGTLYPSSSGIESQIKQRFRACAQRRLRMSDKEVRKLLERYRQEYRSSVLGLKEHHGIDPFEFYEELYDGIDIRLMSPKPGLNEALRRLSGHVPLHVLSNSNRSFVNRGLDFLGLREYIANVFAVEDNNFIRKPHGEVYIAMVSQLGISAKSICMFDDIPSSLRTAKTIGFVTVLVGNGLRESGFIDLHTREEFSDAPEYCDYAVLDIVQFINNMILV